MPSFILRKTTGIVPETFRMGSAAAPLVQNDRGKAVTLKVENQVDLAQAGDEIFGFVNSISLGTHDGFITGGVDINGFQEVDTGSVAVGKIVKVVSTPASGTVGLTVVEAVDAADEPKVLIKWMVVRPGLVQRI